MDLKITDCGQQRGKGINSPWGHPGIFKRGHGLEVWALKISRACQAQK